MVSTEAEGPVRSSDPVTNRRRILCVFPRYTPAFGTFNHAYRLMKGVRAFMPPQGLLLIAAYMPQRISPGPMPCWSAACTSRRRRSTISPRARMRPAR